MKKLHVLLLSALMASGIAMAKDDNPEMATCRADMEKHCAKVEPGEGRQMKCMYDVRDKISPACAAIIKEKYERFEAFRKQKEGKK